MYFWVNNQGKSVWSMNNMPIGKSALTGFDKFTDDDIIACADYIGDVDPDKVNLRVKDGGHPMIKKAFETLGNKISDARFLVDLFVTTNKGTEHNVFVLNEQGLKKYQESIKNKQKDVDQGHSKFNDSKNPYKETNAEKYKYDKERHSAGVKEWLQPLKDKVLHVYVCRIGVKEDGKRTTIMNMDIIKDDKFEGLQYLTDNDIVAYNIENGYFEHEQVDLVNGGGERNIIALFKKMDVYQMRTAKLLIVVETSDRKVVSFALNDDGVKRYARAVERYKKNKK